MDSLSHRTPIMTRNIMKRMQAEEEGGGHEALPFSNATSCPCATLRCIVIRFGQKGCVTVKAECFEGSTDGDFQHCWT